MPWQALPVELTLRILEALDPLSLINCRGVTFFNYPLYPFLSDIM
jgi:hypothetical protein